MSFLRLVRRMLGVEPVYSDGPKRPEATEAKETSQAESQPRATRREGSRSSRRTSQTSAGAAQRSRRRPKERATAWIPPGEALMVQGRRLTDGMIYVGSDLRGISQYVGAEPALIDPQLRVDDRFPDVHGQDMSYWPSYSEMTPASRAAYLDWLAEGRPGGAYIGYVFLFFYGIERRMLFDRDREEVPSEETHVLAREIERLLDLYGDNNSFSHYAGDFLSLVKSLQVDREAPLREPPLTHPGWDLPFEVKLGLGSIVAAGDPLPPRWALSWLRLHPETSFRTPAVRCEEEFNALFQVRYEQVHGSGIKIRRNKTTLKHSYQPASGSFRSPVSISADDLPDVSRLMQPLRQLRELAESVTDELDSYSRWVGKHKDRHGLDAIALLPRELIRNQKTDELRFLTARMEAALAGRDAAPISVLSLTEDFPARRPDSFSTKEASAFAQLLEGLGYGLTPDIRYSKVNLTKHERAVVFRLDGEGSEPSDSYLAATVLLQLGAAVSAADGTISSEEERLLEAHLEESLHLSSADQTRLRAYLQWLLVEPPTLARMKARMQDLSASQRSQVARFAITIAGADGVVSSDEVKVLNRVYNLLGLEGDQLHRDIHDLASAPPTQPVTVLRPDEPSGHRIPPPPAQDPDREIIELDREKIVAIMKDTHEVTAILTDIFEGPAEPEPPEEVEDDAAVDDLTPTPAGIAIGLLDPQHAELVRFLASRPNWPRSEFEEASNKLGLMPAGAIEAINDAAFERCDEPLIEGHDPLDLNEFALKELLNDS